MINRIKRWGVAALGGMGLLLGGVGAGDAQAAVAVCSVQTTPLAFGSYLGTTLTSTATVTTTCDLPNTVVQVQLDKGQGGTLAARAMKTTGGAALQYNLYTDATYKTVWGDGTLGSFVPTGTNLTVYGKIPGNQTVAPGNYGDTVVVTIVW